MFDLVKQWYNNRFSDPDAVTLVFILLSLFAVILYLGDILAPAIVALVIAYLLEWPVSKLVKIGVRRSISVAGVLIVFGCISFTLLVGLNSHNWQQMTSLSAEFPSILQKGQDYL